MIIDESDGELSWVRCARRWNWGTGDEPQGLQGNDQGPLANRCLIKCYRRTLLFRGKTYKLPPDLASRSPNAIYVTFV